MLFRSDAYKHSVLSTLQFEFKIVVGSLVSPKLHQPKGAFIHLGYAGNIFPNFDYLDFFSLRSWRMRLLKEVQWELKLGSTFRVSVPELKKYISFSNWSNVSEMFSQYKSGREALYNLTQTWSHFLCWHYEMLLTLLKEVGFISFKECSFKSGANTELILDCPVSAWVSLHLEAIA